MEGRPSWASVELACRFRLPNSEGPVAPIPHLPHVPQDWNGILVMAEAQNLSSSGRPHRAGMALAVARYAEVVKDMDEVQQAQRLSDRRGFEGVDALAHVHVKPWHSGPLPLAVQCRWPDDDWTRCAVTNAIPWSWVERTPRGNEKDAPAPGRKPSVIDSAVGFLRAAFADRAPVVVVACGGKAHAVAARLPWPRLQWRQGGAQSLIQERRHSSRAGWSRDLLLVALPRPLSEWHVARHGTAAPDEALALAERASARLSRGDLLELSAPRPGYAQRDPLLYLMHALSAPVLESTASSFRA